MRIDKSYGFAAYWVNGAFYRVRKADPRIREWINAIGFSKRQIKKLEVKPISKYFSQEKRDKKIETHKENITHHLFLIKQMKIMKPFHKHAIKMINNGIIQDDWKGNP